MAAAINPNHSGKIDEFVEIKTTYSALGWEINVFEAPVCGKEIPFTFVNPVFITMISGKKIIHLKGVSSFEFLPGESMVLPGNVEIKIDFPESTINTPTKCLTIEIDKKMIKDTMAWLTHKAYEPKIDISTTHFNNLPFHLNNEGIKPLVERLLIVYAEEHTSKEIFIDLLIKELVARILKTKAGFVFASGLHEKAMDARLEQALEYIDQNLHREISADELSNKAFMSKSHFFRTFKIILGETPTEYINKKRISLAKKLIQSTGKNLNQIAYEIGFNNVNYFNRLFKKYEEMTPTQYRDLVCI